MARLHLPNDYTGDRVRQKADGTWLGYPRPWAGSHIRQETNREYRLRRRAAAAIRQKEYDALDIDEKIGRLVGDSTRQRARLGIR